MEPARPLRDVFTDLVGTDRLADPAEALRAGGHPDLPDALVSEAVSSYADTAPVEVAEHLAPYVMAHAPVPQSEAADVDPGSWLGLVATAPAPDVDPLSDLDDVDHMDDVDDVDHLDQVAPPAPAESTVDDVDGGPDLSFGHGQTAPAVDPGHPMAADDPYDSLSGDTYPTDGIATGDAAAGIGSDPSWLDGPDDGTDHGTDGGVDDGDGSDVDGLLDG